MDTCGFTTTLLIYKSTNLTFLGQLFLFIKNIVIQSIIIANDYYFSINSKTKGVCLVSDNLDRNVKLFQFVVFTKKRSGQFGVEII